MIILEGFEDAVLGIGEAVDLDTTRIIYDYEKCISILIEENNWSEEEAIEWMDFNVIHADMGPGNPVFVFTPDYIDGLSLEATGGVLH